MPYKYAYNAELFECLILEEYGFGENVKIVNDVWCFFMCFVLYIDVLSVSMKSNVFFCIYEHI